MTDSYEQTTKSSVKKPVVLCILDGWGIRGETLNNAIKTGTTPHWDNMSKAGPKTKLSASGVDVGLPDRQMGNSEVGHMTIGSGRIMLQDLPRIDTAIHDGTLDNNPQLLSFINNLKQSGGTCHLMGLLSDGGVHSHQWHMRTLAAIVCSFGVPVNVHAFLDGRDTPPKSAATLVRRFETESRYMPCIKMATVTGRYWVMDRDQRWDRVQKAYDCLVDAKGQRFDKAADAIKAAYETGVSDEFVEPTAIGDFAGMQDGDGILMANFRTDRAREILTALATPDFTGFERDRVVEFAGRCGMVDYSDDLKSYFQALFPPIEMQDILSEVLSNAGLKQLHISETEKYAHVTFFFNGGREKPFPGEDRILINSPDVATYDLKPEMSAYEVTDNLIKAIEQDKYDFIVVNFANGDMVGHTGIMSAAVKAVEAVDDCLGRLQTTVKNAGGTMLVTADHGNCEKMLDGTQPHTAHTLFPVPLILINGPDDTKGLNEGGLADLAPTVLHLMGQPVPDAMTGKNLLKGNDGCD